MVPEVQRLTLGIVFSGTRTTLGWSSVWMRALISVRASSAKRASSRLTATGRPSRAPSSTTVPPLP